MTKWTAQRPKGWWLPGISPVTWMCGMGSLGLLLIAMNFTWAAEHEGGAPKNSGEAGKPVIHSRVISAEEPVPKLTTTIDGEEQTILKIAPKAKITLNGRPALFTDLKKGDVVKVTTAVDDPTVAVAVEAVHPDAGKVVNLSAGELTLTTNGKDRHVHKVPSDATITLNGETAALSDLKPGDPVKVTPGDNGDGVATVEAKRESLLHEFWENFRHNLFKPILLFFYMGFSVPILKVAFEFPHIIYQGLTIYLLIAIGWHGGEELAHLKPAALKEALGFMTLGFITNFFIGIAAFGIIRGFIPKMRRIDAATVSAYYGSDSAGTFVTCVGVLSGAGIAYAAYMPVMLAVMEIPGCLVGLFLVSKLRRTGMDPLGNMPEEPGYDPNAKPPVVHIEHGHGHNPQEKAIEEEARLSLENKEDEIEDIPLHKQGGIFNAELLREVFLNPGLFLLFGGILIGYVSGLQGHKVTDADDKLFLDLFQGLLCLFLLEMGMTASRRLRDLKTAGWKFIVFGLLAPNLFATTGICVAHAFSKVTGSPLELGTYVLFSVLCGAASYIAVPAIQRLAIPEASPTLPLAASLGLTFSYNVTIGIPVYIMIAQLVMRSFPVV